MYFQVLEWTQQILRIGEAFSGAECTSLRDVLARQSGKFFDAFHDANLQVGPFYNNNSGNNKKKNNKQL